MTKGIRRKIVGAIIITAVILLSSCSKGTETTYSGTIIAITYQPMGEFVRNFADVYFEDGRKITFANLPEQLTLQHYYIIKASSYTDGRAATFISITDNTTTR
jgi:hypothetical protein